MSEPNDKNAVAQDGPLLDVIKKLQETLDLALEAGAKIIVFYELSVFLFKELQKHLNYYRQLADDLEQMLVQHQLHST